MTAEFGYPPEGCRQRAMREGKAYMRGSCAVCGRFAPRWRECDMARDSPPPPPPKVSPSPPSFRPAASLTEDDVRRIVREELAKMSDPIKSQTFGGKP